ncbi:MAG: SHD1 domain-containing protein [Thermoguttaceae bacterium]
MSRNRGLALLLAVLAVAAWGRETVAQNTPLLRYNYQAGQKRAYDVKIHAELPECDEDYQGTLTWVVASATDQQAVLNDSGSLGKSVKYKANQGGFPPLPMPPMFGGGPRFMRGGAQGVTVDRRGAVLLAGEGLHLPFLLGPQNILVFEECPAQPQASWEKQRDVVIEERQQHRFPHGPFGGAAPGTQRTSKEQINYTIGETKGDTVQVTKRYSLKSQEAAQPAKFDMTGEGHFVFDLRQGLIQSSSMKYSIQVNEGNTSTKIPITISYELVAPAELAKREKAAEEARRKAAEEARPKPFKPGQRQQLLDDLAAAEEHTVQTAAEQLTKIVRDDNPAEIAKALAPLLTHSNGWVQSAAAKALVVWATPEVGPELIQASTSSNGWVRAPVVEALGHVKTEDAARAAGAAMKTNRGEAIKAMKAMGPIAEQAAIEALSKSDDGWANRDLLALLANIGGEDSLEAVQTFLHRATWFDKADAERAHDAIKRRLRASGHKITAAKPNASAPAASPVLRKWRDVSGNFEVEAVYLGLQDNKVRIRRKDGRVIRVPLDRLSEEDRKYVAEEAKKPKPTNPFD